MARPASATNKEAVDGWAIAGDSLLRRLMGEDDSARESNVLALSHLLGMLAELAKGGG